MRNNTHSSNIMLNQAIEGLRSRQPDGWRLTLGKSPRGLTSYADARLRVRGPDGASAVLIVGVKPRVSPRQAAEVAAKMAEAFQAAKLAGALLISNYMSELSRKRIRMAGVNYYDLTGNIWIATQRPGLLIERQGSDKDPSPPRRVVRSLKGAKAARIVRALCDLRSPIGVRELARLTGSNPGYVSRVVGFLDSEDLIRRGKVGEIVESDWQDLIRRWSQDYSVEKTHRVAPYLVPRGLSIALERLRAYAKRYALTGNAAVPEEALIASGRLVTKMSRETPRF